MTASTSSQKHSGFTLVEIIIVVVLLGVLASIAIPKVIGPNERMRSSEGMQILAVILSAQKNHFAEVGTYASGDPSAVLDITIPASVNFSTPVAIPGTANNVASIARNDGTYTLTITTAGVINCAGAGCGAIHCSPQCRQ